MFLFGTHVTIKGALTSVAQSITAPQSPTMFEFKQLVTAVDVGAVVFPCST